MMREQKVPRTVHYTDNDTNIAVSYTHLTLPTKA